MGHLEIVAGIVIQQEGQGPENILPNSSVTLAHLSAEVLRVLNSDTDLGIGVVIDWALSNVFYTVRTTAPGAYSFLNLLNGKTIVVIIKNSSGGAFTPTFPAGYLIASPLTAIVVGQENVYTFIRSNGKTYLNVVEGMV